MSNKILIISGPTATGKTSLAVKLAKKYPSELISADSRQLYRGFDIGTGKDHPQSVKVHLVDILDPDQSFSVAQFRALALKKIRQIHQKKKLPIIVGGTGQYIDSLISKKNTFHIKPVRFLRLLLNPLPVSVLQFLLKLINKKLFTSLNNSDRNNPHRLIRKMEIAISNITNKISPLSSKGEFKGDFRNFNYLHLSLTANNKFLYHRIDQRVKNRLKQGLLKEIKTLLKKYSWNKPAFNTLAYKQFKPYFHKKTSLKEVVNRWRFDEHAYARRQKTWFKHYSNIHFIDISKKSYLNQVLTLVGRWYNQL